MVVTFTRHINFNAIVVSYICLHDYGEYRFIDCEANHVEARYNSYAENPVDNRSSPGHYCEIHHISATSCDRKCV